MLLTRLPDWFRQAPSSHGRDGGTIFLCKIQLLFLYKSDPLFEFGTSHGIGDTDHFWGSCPPGFGQYFQVPFSNGIFRVDFECSFQSSFCLVITFLHHQANPYITPGLWHTIAHLNGKPESLFGFFPVVCLHEFQATLIVPLLLDELIECEVWSSLFQCHLGKPTTLLYDISKSFRQLRVGV